MNLRRILLACAAIATSLMTFFLASDRHRSRPASENAGKPFLLKNAPFVTATVISNHVVRPKPSTTLNSSLRKLGASWESPTAEPATAQFAEWFAKFRAAAPTEKASLEKEGKILASQRREVLKRLIESDPERALENAVPFSVRRQLPESIQSLLEERVSGRGELAVFGVMAEPGKETKIAPIFRTASIGGREFKAFAYGRRLGEPTQENIPLNGIAVENFLALNENPVRILEEAEAEQIPQASEALCSVSGQLATVNEEETALDVGGEIVFVCGVAHASLLNDQLIAAADRAADVAASTRTEGEKKLILIRVDFPDKPGNPFPNSTGTNLVSGLNSFYLESSYNRTGFSLVGQGSDYTPTFRMPHDSAYYGTNDYFAKLRSDARAAASAYGYVLSDYDYDLICMTNVTGFNWAGLGYIGAAGAWIRNSFGTGVSAHELGHNYGLYHANYWDTGGASTIGTAGTNVEYGDIFDTMGSAAAGNNHFNARNKRLLNWIQSGEMITVTSSGTFRVYCHDNPNSTGIRALSIAKNASTNYWVEFRQKFTSNQWLMNGAGLRWAPNNSEQSMLLDTTPGSPDGKNDSAIVIGRTFSDKQAGIHITPIRKGGTVPESLDVVVNRGSFPGNVAPTISIISSATNVVSGTPLNFTATASDANGDTLAYYWDFGDKSFGTNGPTASKIFNSTKEYVVRCTATDMKGGVASDSIVIRVNSPTTYRISGQVKAGNVPVEGVRVYASSALTTYTDSDGTYNLVAVSSGNYTVKAQLDGYTFYEMFSGPVTVGPSATGVDFNTMQITPPTITSQPQSKSVAAGANVAFIVSATGDSLKYQWLFNGALMLDRTNSALTLANVQAANAGNYSVIVSNAANSVTSSNAALVVNVPPIISAISEKSISEGALLSFTVSASDAVNNVTNVFADFDQFQNGLSSVMFRAPSYSPTTATNLDGLPNLLMVSTNMPAGLADNSAALNASWSFKSTAANPWLRLTTFSANTLPNPTIHFSHRLRFNVFSDRELKVALCLRETGSNAAIGDNGGTAGVIEWAGVTNVVDGTPYSSRVVPANTWSTVEFDLADEPIVSFSGGNGVLESATGKGVLESLCFSPNDGSGAYNVYLDNFADVDISRLSYSLVSGAPVGASIDPQTGVFSWTPDETQGPGTYNIGLRVTDNGVPSLSSTNVFSVSVLESNSPPTLAAISNRFVTAGKTLTFTNSASDSDWPPNALAFGFGENALVDATLDANSGVLTWIAPESDVPLTNTVSIVVSDNGSPSQSDTNTFEIVVMPPFRAEANISTGNNSIEFRWPSFPGKTYQLQYKDDLQQTNWIDFGDPLVGDGEELSVSGGAPTQAQRFFRIMEID